MSDRWGVGERFTDPIALQPISEEVMVCEPEIIDATMYVSTMGSVGGENGRLACECDAVERSSVMGHLILLLVHG